MGKPFYRAPQRGHDYAEITRLSFFGSGSTRMCMEGEHICAYLWITSNANGKNCLKTRVWRRRVAYARPLHVGGGLSTPSLYVGVVVDEALLLVARLLVPLLEVNVPI